MIYVIVFFFVIEEKECTFKALIFNRIPLEDKGQAYNNLRNKIADLETQLDIISKHSSDVMLLFDRNIKPTFIGTSIKNFTGYTNSEIKEKDFFSLIHPHEKDEFLQLIDTVKTDSSEKHIIQFRLKHRNDYYFWTECIITSLPDAHSNCQILLTISNINDRKIAELELIKSEKRYLMMFENMDSGIAIYRAIDNGNDFEFVNINRAAEKILNQSKKKLLKNTLLQTFPETEYLPLYNALRKVYTTGKAEQLEPIHFKNGAHESWRRYSLYKLESNEIIAIIKDVTDSIEAQKKLTQRNKEYSTLNKELIETNKELEDAILRAKENEQKYQLLFENVTLGFALHEIICDEDNNPINYTFIDINPAFEKLTEMPASEVIGKTIIDIYPNIEKQKIETYGKVALSNQTIEFEEYSTVLKKSYKIIAFCPRIGQFAVLIDDISDKKGYEEELKAAKLKAEESDKLKSAFLANMSHEIRTPMNGIVGFAEMLANPTLSAEKRAYFAKIISESSNQLLTIVNDILDISKIETETIKFKSEEFNLNDQLSELFANYHINKTNTTISLHIHKELSDEKSMIKTDKTRLKQVLNNLLNNAFKFTLEGHIEFGYTIKDNFIQFFVKDSGIGIDKQHQDVIFEHFRKAEIQLSRQFGGTGLGLSISKKLVELMGGKIWLESELDKGTNIYFTLPYIKGTIQTEINNNNKPTSKTLKILIAEDEEINFLYLQEILSVIDSNIIHAKNGAEAVEKYKENPDIDIILMDIKMPVMNGYEATRAIKKINKNAFVIAQTAHAMVEDSNIAISKGCDAYLSKPISTVHLMQLIKKYKEGNY